MDVPYLDDLLSYSQRADQIAWLNQHAPTLNAALLDQLQQEAQRRERDNPHTALTIAHLVALAGELWQSKQTTAVSLHLAANAHLLLFEHTQALDLYKEAAALYQSLGLEQEAARVGVGQIATMKYLGLYDEAITLSQWVEDVFHVAGDQRALGKIVMNRGNIFARQKKFHQALATFAEARTIFATIPDPYHLAITDVNDANVHMELDQFRQAEKIYQQARVYFQAEGLNSIVAQVEHNIAHLQMAQGHYQQALVTINRARAFFLTQSNLVEVASIDLIRSDIYLALNLWQEAFEMAQAAYPIFEEAGMLWEIGRLFLNEAAAMARIEQMSSPDAALEKARDIFTAENNDIWLAMTDLYQATFDLRLGHLTYVHLNADRSARIFRQHGLHSRAAQCEIILGELALQEGDQQRAHYYFSQALETLQEMDIPAIAFACAYGLGRTCVARRQRTQALTHYRNAIANIERLQAAIGAEDYKIAFLSDKLQVYESLIFLSLDLNTPIAQQEAFEHVERAKSRTLLDALARETVTAVASASEASLLADIDRLKQELNWYYNRLNQPQLDAPTDLPALKDAVSRRERALSRLIKQWRSPDLVTAPRNPIWTVTVAQIQAILPSNTILLEFYCARNQILLFGITQNEIWSVTLPTSIEQINEQVSQLRFQINKFSYGSAYRQRHAPTLQRSTEDALKSLYEALIAPIQTKLHDHHHLLIVPHGILHYVPFQALFDGKQYLIDSKTIAYAPSATILYRVFNTPTPTTTAPPLILGLADDTIPYAQAEAETIARLFKTADVRLHDKATLTTFKPENQTPTFVHLSTHATFRADNPLFSALKLADGWLSVNDIYGMDAAVPLITLSACETGRNQVIVGDELVGLCRGFFAAGVQALVVSLWTVEDTATADLMTHFYQALRAGQSLNVALRQAQLRIKAEHPHPYYWAPFILTGNAQTKLSF